jgi:hypothetical protein
MADQSLEWKTILWREQHYCNDADYARYLRYAIADLTFNWLAPPKASRPYAHEVEAALREACAVSGASEHGWRKRLRRLDQIKMQTAPVERFVADLQSFYWLKRFIARHVLFYRGGEAGEILIKVAQDSSSAVQEVSLWLLQSISADTTGRLAQVNHWACPQCLTCCGAHSLELKWQPDLLFYGCRVCRRSSGLLSCPKGIVAVLDNRWTKKYELREGCLRVNWISHRELFDLDQVEIIRATDEEVERFAVQLGNDTDPVRRPRYEQLPCIIGPDCRLSENSIRILASIFKEVLTGPEALRQE